MTVLSNNIQRLRVERGLTIKYIADQCEVSPAAASQWMQKKNPYTPSIDSLLTLAGIFQTTIEDLVTNPRCKSGEVVSPALNFMIVEHVFKLIEPDSVLSYAFAEASPKKKAYLFGLMYSLLEDAGIAEVSIRDVLELMGIETDERAKTKKAATRPVKRSSKRPPRKKR